MFGHKNLFVHTNGIYCKCIFIKLYEVLNNNVEYYQLGPLRDDGDTRDCAVTRSSKLDSGHENRIENR